MRSMGDFYFFKELVSVWQQLICIMFIKNIIFDNFNNKYDKKLKADLFEN